MWLQEIEVGCKDEYGNKRNVHELVPVYARRQDVDIP